MENQNLGTRRPSENRLSHRRIREDGLGNAKRYMRYQWIVRLLGNPLVISDAIIEPFAREVLERAGADGAPLGLILDQSKVSDRHQVLMLALRWGERALPLAWRVEETEGAIGFETQKALLEVVVPWLPAPARVRLLGDRFYGTADLIGWCQQRGWDYRLRLKGNLVVVDGAGRTTTGQCAKDRVYYLEDVELTGRREPISESFMIRGTRSPGSSPCLKNRDTCARRVFRSLGHRDLPGMMT